MEGPHGEVPVLVRRQGWQGGNMGKSHIVVSIGRTRKDRLTRLTMAGLNNFSGPEGIGIIGLSLVAQCQSLGQGSWP